MLRLEKRVDYTLYFHLKMEAMERHFDDMIISK